MENNDLLRVGIFQESRLDVNVEATIFHITREAREAAVEQARLTYAVPAAEKTARTREMTKWEHQFTLRHAMVVVAILALAVLIYLKPETALGMVGLGGVLAGVYAVTTYITKKSGHSGEAVEEDGKQR